MTSRRAQHRGSGFCQRRVLPALRRRRPGCRSHPLEIKGLASARFGTQLAAPDWGSAGRPSQLQARRRARSKKQRRSTRQAARAAAKLRGRCDRPLPRLLGQQIRGGPLRWSTGERVPRAGSTSRQWRIRNRTAGGWRRRETGGAGTCQTSIRIEADDQPIGVKTC